jgi:competence protein ComEC
VADVHWKVRGLAAASAGLALSALAPGFIATAAAWPLALLALALLLSRGRGGAGGGAFAPVLVLAGLVGGLAVGEARLNAIDAGALRAAPGSRLVVEGHLVAVPRRSGGRVRAQVASSHGRVLVESREPVPDLPIGAGVRASGVLAQPPSWYEATLRRQGIAMVLRTRRLQATGKRRTGLQGRLDAIRDRAAQSLGRGIPAREAALARGFVLGQDDRIDAETVEDFRRSGLSHLLAVSGQNVLLLALLATPLLAALGIPLRSRLAWLLCLIAVYVPLAGAGPSIQRAGVMGAAALITTIAGRPGSRAYALLGACAATLALNPRASGDPGWQLSFAAVLGIHLLAAPIRSIIAASAGRGTWQRALAEGAAVTVAATLATAPLIAYHFGTVPLGSLGANLLALPAVAPSMWLGMISAGAGQFPGLPVEALNWANSLLLAYIAQVAAWFAAPSWAVVEVRIGALGVAATYAGAAILTAAGLRLAAVRRAGAVRRSRARGQRGAHRRLLAAVVLIGLLLAPIGGDSPPAALHEAHRPGLRVDILDVGQGDAIALQPADGQPVLFDAGPPAVDLAQALGEIGIERLGAVLVTHDQADHAGGVPEVLDELPVERILFPAAGASLVSAARAAGAPLLRVEQGSRFVTGDLGLEVLWPPPSEVPAPHGDPNTRSVVVLATWHQFAMLLTGDAEAEVAPVDPGPIDVLKVAHHGSEDPGLASLLRRARPELAVISVGAGNPFGHPAPGTLRTLAAAGVRILRTDRDGSVTLHVDRSGVVAISAGAD